MPGLSWGGTVLLLLASAVGLAHCSDCGAVKNLVVDWHKDPTDARKSKLAAEVARVTGTCTYL